MRIVIRRPGCETFNTSHRIAAWTMSRHNDYPAQHEEIYDEYYNRIYYFKVDGPDSRPIVRKPRSNFSIDYWSFDVVGLSYERLSFDVYWVSNIIRRELL